MFQFPVSRCSWSVFERPEQLVAISQRRSRLISRDSQLLCFILQRGVMFRVHTQHARPGRLALVHVVARPGDRVGQSLSRVLQELRFRSRRRRWGLTGRKSSLRDQLWKRRVFTVFFCPPFLFFTAAFLISASVRFRPFKTLFSRIFVAALPWLLFLPDFRPSCKVSDMLSFVAA